MNGSAREDGVMKMKIFSEGILETAGDDSDLGDGVPVENVETQVNEWLAAHRNVRVVNQQLSTCCDGGIYRMVLTIAIWYQEQE